MKKRIVVQTIPIHFPSQISHFEIRIPENTMSITGVQTSVRFTNQPIVDDTVNYIFRAKYLLGEVRLQGANHVEWFYSGSIHETALPEERDFDKLILDFEMPYKAQGRTEIEILNNQPDTTCIKGFYKDIIAQTLNQNLNYTVSVILHLQTKN